MQWQHYIVRGMIAILAAIVPLIAPPHVQARVRATVTLVATIPVGRLPLGLLFDQYTDHLFVADFNDNAVTVVDGETYQPLYTVPTGIGPVGFVLNALVHRLFVLNSGVLNGTNLFSFAGNGPITVMNSATGAVLRDVTVGVNPSDFVLSRSNNRLFVVNSGAEDASGSELVHGTISLLNGTTGTLLHTIKVDDGACAVAIDNRAQHVFVVSQGFNYPNVQDERPGSVSMLNASSGHILAKATVGTSACGVASDDASGRIFVINSGSNTVSMLDAVTGSVLVTALVGHNPGGLALDRQTGRVFVTNLWGRTSPGSGLYDKNGQSLAPGTVSVLDAQEGIVLRTITVGREPSQVLVDAQRGTAFVANSASNSISVLNAASGTLISTVHLAASPNAMELDEQQGRVFVSLSTANSVVVLREQTIS